MNRRDFLKTLGLTSIAPLIPNAVTINPVEPKGETPKQEPADEDYIVLRIHKNMMKSTEINLQPYGATSVGVEFFVMPDETDSVCQEIHRAWGK